jgi:alpha/beta superfamily hydrolase
MSSLAETPAAEGLVRERVRIATPTRGTLAGELAYGATDPAFGVVITNPHPHMGGSMENNLVAALASRLAEEGAATLRFDYAGVGESDGSRLNLHESLAGFWRTGHAPEDPLMADDARAAYLWMRRQLEAPLSVIGYSFGAWAAVEAMDNTAQPAALVLISPTITQHAFDRLGARPIPMLVAYSDNDFATPAESTRRWIAGLGIPVVERCFCGAEHFFRGCERTVAEVCIGFFRSLLS